MGFPWSWSFLGLVIIFLLSSFGFYTIYFQYLVPLTLLGCVVIDESVWEDVLSLVFVMFCHVCCVLFMCWFPFAFLFFFFLRQTTLCMVCLKSPCVFILGGGLGFLGWGGFFVAMNRGGSRICKKGGRDPKGGAGWLK